MNVEITDQPVNNKTRVVFLHLGSQVKSSFTDADAAQRKADDIFVRSITTLSGFSTLVSTSQCHVADSHAGGYFERIDIVVIVRGSAAFCNRVSFFNHVNSCAEVEVARTTSVGYSIIGTTAVVNHGVTRVPPWVIHRTNNEVVESLVSLTDEHLTPVSFKTDVAVTKRDAAATIHVDVPLVTTETCQAVAQVSFAFRAKT